MSTHLVHMESLANVETKIRRQFEKLTDLHDGRMMGHVLDYGTHDSAIANATVFYIMERARVVAWGMVYNNRFPESNRANGWRIGTINHVDLYTRESKRGKGYGSAIAAAMARQYESKSLCGLTNLTTIYQRHGFQQNTN